MICKNYQGCRLVHTEVVEPDETKREKYIEDYCVTEEEWKKCNRYTTRRALWICPDFILPDSGFTEDEVIDRYEQNGKVEI
ncbi:MAG: hypothetical protein KBC43_08470 [Bacteroidales bacterium]|nr:hypothetical protein [Bacteroidales bacterium]